MSKKEDTHTFLVETGLKLAETMGLHGFSMRELARVAECANGLTYYHFADVETLRTEIVWMAKSRKNFKVLLQAVGLGYSRSAELNEEILAYLRGEIAGE